MEKEEKLLAFPAKLESGLKRRFLFEVERDPENAFDALFQLNLVLELTTKLAK